MFSILSFGFIAFMLAALALYYATPAKYQWVALLAASIAFFCLSGDPRLLVFLAAGSLLTYLGANAVEAARSPRLKKAALIACIACVVSLLLALKFASPLSGALGLSQAGAGWILAPIGISYYTLSGIGYVCDVYWEKTRAQKNFGKHLLFTGYFPLLTSGPIVRYGETAPALFSPHPFRFDAVRAGLLRMLWGFFQKLVISERLALLSSQVLDHPETWTGLYIVVGVASYAIRIYTDFSGCMDIVLGASEAFGVPLPENFARPFFARTLSEFWRRWHITLGLWAKDYLLYPLLKSRALQGVGARVRRRFGKQAGKDAPTYIGLLIMWLIIGLWHGFEWRYAFAAGFLPWLFLVLGRWMAPWFQRVSARLHVRRDLRAYHLLERARTFLLMCVVWLFATAASFPEGAARALDSLFTGEYNVSAVARGLMTNFPIGAIDLAALVPFLALLLAVDVLRERGVRVLPWLFRRPVPVQWFCELALIFMVLIFGMYGVNYNPVDFIYGGF